MASEPHSTALCFGPFRFDRETGELWRDGCAIHLPPLPTRALALLAARPNRLVPRQRLRDLLWTTPPLEWEKALYFCMLQIRRALGEAGGDPVHLHTVPRRGYRLVTEAPSTSSPFAKSTRRIAPAAAATLLATVFLGGLATWGDHIRGGQAEPAAAADAAVIRLEREARYLLEQHRLDALEGARDRYRRAVALAPNRASAWSGLAYARFMLQVRDRATEDATREAANRALALDPRLAEPHVVLAELALTRDWDLDGASRHFQRALELEPQSIPVRMHRAAFLLVLGRFEEAIDEVEWALDQDAPLALLAGDAAWIFHYAGDHRRAEKAARTALELEPDRLWLRELLIHILLAQHQTVEARREATDYLASVDPAARANGPDMLERFRLYLVERSVHGGSSVARAMALARIGDHQTALDSLEDAFRHHSPALLRMIRHPALAPLHGEPEFQGLVLRLGLSWKPGSDAAPRAI